jgi:hypothetical protein
MRKSLIVLPFLVGAAPALAQPAPSGRDTAEIQRVLADPSVADRLADTVQGLSNALLDVPVGQVQAAIEGHPATQAERHRTVRDIARKEDPNFDRNLQRQIAQAKPMVRQSMRAMSDALPAVMQSLEQASRAIERVTANMPDPTYPVR